MLFQLTKKRSLLLQILSIFIGYVLLGQILCIYQVSQLIWLMTILLILYLSWSGTGAIALVLSWIIIVIGFGIYKLYAFEQFKILRQMALTRKMAVFMYSLHRNFFRPTIEVGAWAAMFFFIFVLATGLAFLHGFTHDVMEKLGLKEYEVFIIMSLISLIGLKIGQIVIQTT